VVTTPQNVRQTCVKISPVTPTAHITHTARTCRSDALCGRLKDGDAATWWVIGNISERMPLREHPGQVQFLAPERGLSGAWSVKRASRAARTGLRGEAVVKTEGVRRTNLLPGR
jgi:hypothetical protein